MSDVRVSAPEEFFTACRALEAGVFTEASQLAMALSSRFPSAPEPSILQALVRRRASRSGEPWIDALVASWHEVGSPPSFAWRISGRAEPGVAPRATSGSEDPLPRLVAAIGSEYVESPIMLMHLQALRAGTADELVSNGLAAATAARTPLDRLWILSVLSHRQCSAEIRQSALVTRRLLLASLVAEYPDDFHVCATALLEDGEPHASPLTDRQIAVLKSAIERAGPRRVDCAQVFESIVQRRAPRTSAEFEGAFADAVALCPEPLLDLNVRAEATFAQRGRPRAHRL